MAPGAGVTHTDLCASFCGNCFWGSRLDRLFNLIRLARAGRTQYSFWNVDFSQAVRMEATAAAFDAQLKAFLAAAAATVTA